MSPLETLSKIRLLTGTLNPEAFISRIGEWRRGGLPGTSMPDGSRSSETPLPKSDPTDRRLARALRLHRRHLDRALENLQEARRLEDAIAALPHDEASKLAAELVSPKAQNCTNCHRPVERTASDKLLGGRCRNCHDWLKGHGNERPQDLWESEIEKRARQLAARRTDPKVEPSYRTDERQKRLIP